MSSERKAFTNTLLEKEGRTGNLLWTRINDDMG